MLNSLTLTRSMMEGTLKLSQQGPVTRARCAGQHGRSAAIGQVAAPRAQMLGKQDWRYVSTASQVRPPVALRLVAALQGSVQRRSCPTGAPHCAKGHRARRC